MTKIESLFFLGFTVGYLFIGGALIGRVVLGILRGLTVRNGRTDRPTVAERKWKQSWITAQKTDENLPLSKPHRRPSNPGAVIFPKTRIAKLSS